MRKRLLVETSIKKDKGVNMRESQTQAAILKYLGNRKDCRVWRNNTGSVSGIVARIERALLDKLPKGLHRIVSSVLAPFRRGVDFGLVGSADILGIRKIDVVVSSGYDVVLCSDGRANVERPDDHDVIGQFLAVEVKSDTGRQSEAQRNFQSMVEAFGGLYILARDVSDLYPWFPKESP